MSVYVRILPGNNHTIAIDDDVDGNTFIGAGIREIYSYEVI